MNTAIPKPNGATMLERWARLLEAHIRTNCEQMMREPSGQLVHPYTVPSTSGSPYYSKALWDWGSWSTGIVPGQVEDDTHGHGRFAAYEQDSRLNFLDYTDGDGIMPVQLTPEETPTHCDPTRSGDFSENMHKPVIAQHKMAFDSRALVPASSRVGRPRLTAGR